MAEKFANADAYERLMGRWSARLAPLFVAFARLRGGNRVLDVGCGTGSLTRALADLPGQPAVAGIDPAQPFIDYCRQRHADTRFAFDCGNAMALPYPDDAFDHALSLLVFMFIPQPEKAAAEMRRVTRADGTVAACTWDRDTALSTIFWGEATKLDPSAEARSERGWQCIREGQLAALWREAGMENIEETALQMQAGFVSFDDFWLPLTGGTGATGVYVAGLSPENRNALRAALRRRLLGDRADGPITLPLRAWAVRGTVPVRT